MLIVYAICRRGSACSDRVMASTRMIIVRRRGAEWFAAASLDEASISVLVGWPESRG